MSWTPKDPGSVEYFFFDFGPSLEPLDVVATLVSVVLDQGDGLLTLAGLILSGNMVRVTLSGGTLATSYRLVATVTTVQAETLVLHGSLAIRPA